MSNDTELTINNCTFTGWKATAIVTMIVVVWWLSGFLAGFLVAWR